MGELPPVIQAGANIAFLGTTTYLMYRVVTRRVDMARNEPLVERKEETRTTPSEEEEEEEGQGATNRGQAFVGGMGALAVGVVLFQAGKVVDAYMLGRAQQLAGRDEAIQQLGGTLRTMASGVVFLASFVFAANGAGLIALASRDLLSGSPSTPSEREDSSE